MAVFINPFFYPASIGVNRISGREPSEIKLGGCLTDKDEDVFYSHEELKARKERRCNGVR